MKTTSPSYLALATLLLLGACGDDGPSELFCETSADCDDSAHREGTKKFF